jgi:hypothetical protein
MLHYIDNVLLNVKLMASSQRYVLLYGYMLLQKIERCYVTLHQQWPPCCHNTWRVATIIHYITWTVTTIIHYITWTVTAK